MIPNSVRSPEGARIGLLIRAGDWDAAHEAAQNLQTREGSFWHGILHRGQEDWGNSSYWFRRVSSHPVFAAIHAEAEAVIARHGAPGFSLGPVWDPFQFIRWCEQTAPEPNSAKARLIVELQVIEWRHLFQWCACEEITIA